MEMKIFNDRFTLKLLRENIIYIIAVFFFILLLIIFLPSQLQTASELNSLANEKNELLMTKKKQYEEAQKQLSFDVNAMDAITKTMFPAEEDYFSIFRSLELLAERSGIFIETFSSPFGNKQGPAVKVEVSALGNAEAVSRLLTDYQLKSSRLATIDRFSFEPPSSKITFSINFFTIPESTTISGSSGAVSQPILELIIKNADSAPREAFTGTDYLINSNPFSSSIF